MAKGSSPWGDPGKDGEVTTGTAPAEGEPPAPAGEPPRNPWLIPDADNAPRRSASMDDIFRGRSGGSGRSGLSVNFRWVPWLIGGSVAAWILATSVHVLAQDERALVMTMGRYTETVGPGLHFTLPWPLQSMLRQQTGSEVRTQIPEKEAEALMPTADGELINVTFQVRWRITDLKQFTFNLPDGEAAIRRLADAQMRAGVAEMPFDDLYGARRQSELQQRTMARMQRVLDAWHAGVSLSAVEVVRWDPPAQLSDTFKQISEAKQKADKNHVEAERYSAQLVQIAQARAQDFNKAYRTYKIAPDVTRRSMYDEMMAKVLNNNNVVLGGSGVPASVPSGGTKSAPPPTQGGQ
ncbi:MAG: protease modulator HflK [Novosphingobium sp.]